MAYIVRDISAYSSVEYCCRQLSDALSTKVFLPQSPTYLATLDDYWSLEEADLSPTCIVVPSTAEDVSVAVSILSKSAECRFAVKGGGHSPSAGFANIDAGITIDMTQVNSVALNAEKTTASIGAGATWLEVYQYLDTLGVAVAGGRNADVGVGGLTLGGGISYFSPRVGWACDNVINFEIVLACGELVNANATSRPDLWRALKGGSNNFGIVTRFDLAAFPQGEIWGGSLGHSISSRGEVFEAFAKIASAPKYDPYASLVVGYSFISPAREWTMGHLPTYTKPVENPPAFEPLLAIQPQTQNTLRITTLSNLTNEGSSPPTFNIKFWTGTYGIDVKFLNEIFEITNSTVYDFLPRINATDTVIWGWAYEPLPTVITQYGALKGGNSLGTSPADGNAFVVLLNVLWTDASVNGLIEESARTIMSKVDSAAQSMGLKHDFEYLNYANEEQNPLGSYGLANLERLQEVSRKYDRKGVFQKQVPGGFKLQHQ